MRKRLFIVILLLFLICCFTSCTRNNLCPFIVLNEKFELDQSTYLIVRNNLEEERFEIQYISRNKDKSLYSWLSFSINMENFFWYADVVDPEEITPIKVSSINNNLKLCEFDDSYYYGILGETTVYISYEDLEEELKEHCRNFNPSTESDHTISLKVFGRIVLNRDY